MMWRRKVKPVATVELTTAMYERWLRAQRPPFEWFAGLTEVEQEHLARTGDEYVMGVAESVTPEPKGEDQALEKMAADYIKKTLGGAGTPQAPRPVASMGGVTRRREEKETERRMKDDERKSLFGRKPDSVEANGSE